LILNFTRFYIPYRIELIGGTISLRQIFLCLSAWLFFWAANVLRLRWAIVWNVAKMLLCRNGWGYKQYDCPSCGKVTVDRWVETTLSDVLDVPYQHLIFTIPEELRDWIQCNRTEALNALFGAVSSTLLSWTSQRGYRPGIQSPVSLVLRVPLASCNAGDQASGCGRNSCGNPALSAPLPAKCAPHQ
jgi:hypothetical protein